MRNLTVSALLLESIGLEHGRRSVKGCFPASCIRGCLPILMFVLQVNSPCSMSELVGDCERRFPFNRNIADRTSRAAIALVR